MDMVGLRRHGLVIIPDDACDDYSPTQSPLSSIHICSPTFEPLTDSMAMCWCFRQSWGGGIFGSDERRGESSWMLGRMSGSPSRSTLHTILYLYSTVS